MEKVDRVGRREIHRERETETDRDRGREMQDKEMHIALEKATQHSSHVLSADIWLDFPC